MNDITSWFPQVKRSPVNQSDVLMQSFFSLLSVYTQLVFSKVRLLPYRKVSDGWQHTIKEETNMLTLFLVSARGSLWYIPCFCTSMNVARFRLRQWEIRTSKGASVLLSVEAVIGLISDSNSLSTEKFRTSTKYWLYRTQGWFERAEQQRVNIYPRTRSKWRGTHFISFPKLSRLPLYPHSWSIIQGVNAVNYSENSKPLEIRTTTSCKQASYIQLHALVPLRYVNHSSAAGRFT
jgi:hypothetical protein